MAQVGYPGPEEFVRRCRGATRVGWETSTAIYWLERDPTYTPLLWPMVQAARNRETRIVLSTITELELLVGPLRGGKPEEVLPIRRFLSAHT